MPGSTYFKVIVTRRRRVLYATSGKGDQTSEGASEGASPYVLSTGVDCPPRGTFGARQ